jgi:hypothetical protein
MQLSEHRVSQRMHLQRRVVVDPDAVLRHAHLYHPGGPEDCPTIEQLN